MIGKQTINQKDIRRTRGQSGSSSKNIQIQGRDLIDAAEIGKMNRREAILLIAGTNPKDLKYPVEQHLTTSISTQVETSQVRSKPLSVR